MNRSLAALLALSLAACKQQAPTPPPTPPPASDASPRARAGSGRAGLPADACRRLLPGAEVERLAGTPVTATEPMIMGGDANECGLMWNDPKVVDPGQDGSVASVRVKGAGAADWDFYVREEQGSGFQSVRRDLGFGDRSVLALARVLGPKEREAELRAADAKLEEAYSKGGGKLSLNDVLEQQRRATTPDSHVLDVELGAASFHLMFSTSYVTQEELLAELPKLRGRMEALAGGAGKP